MCAQLLLDHRSRGASLGATRVSGTHEEDRRGDRQVLEGVVNDVGFHTPKPRRDYQKETLAYVVQLAEAAPHQRRRGDKSLGLRHARREASLSEANRGRA